MSMSHRLVARLMEKTAVFDVDLREGNKIQIDAVERLFPKVLADIKGSGVPNIQKIPKQFVLFKNDPEKYVVRWDEYNDIEVNTNDKVFITGLSRTPKGYLFKLKMALGARYYQNVLKAPKRKQWMAFARGEKGTFSGLLKKTGEKISVSPSSAFSVAFAHYVEKSLSENLEAAFKKVVGIKTPVKEEAPAVSGDLGFSLNPNRFDNIAFDINSEDEEYATELLSKMFPEKAKRQGKNLTLEDMADLVGAGSIPGGVKLKVIVRPQSIEIQGSGPHVKSFRRIIEGDGSITNDLLVLRDAPRGTGTKIFAAQVQAAREMGAPEITCIAGKGDKYVGYKVWQKLGYDGLVGDNTASYRIPEKYTDPINKRALKALSKKQLIEIVEQRLDESDLKDALEDFYTEKVGFKSWRDAEAYVKERLESGVWKKNVRVAFLKEQVRKIMEKSNPRLLKWGIGPAFSLQALMSEGIGDWWAENGDEWDASFDLSDDSRSLEVLKAYLNKKSGGDINAWFKTAAEEEDSLTKAGGEFDASDMEEMSDSYEEFINTMPFPSPQETIDLYERQTGR